MISQWTVANGDSALKLFSLEMRCLDIASSFDSTIWIGNFSAGRSLDRGREPGYPRRADKREGLVLLANGEFVAITRFVGGRTGGGKLMPVAFAAMIGLYSMTANSLIIFSLAKHFLECRL